MLWAVEVALVDRHCMQSILLAVLKPPLPVRVRQKLSRLHAIHTACGVEEGQIRAESLRTAARAACAASVPC